MPAYDKLRCVQGKSRLSRAIYPASDIQHLYMYDELLMYSIYICMMCLTDGLPALKLGHVLVYNMLHHCNYLWCVLRGLRPRNLFLLTDIMHRIPFPTREEPLVLCLQWAHAKRKEKCTPVGVMTGASGTEAARGQGSCAGAHTGQSFVLMA